jgi:hypothetical protein
MTKIQPLHSGYAPLTTLPHAHHEVTQKRLTAFADDEAWKKYYMQTMLLQRPQRIMAKMKQVSFDDLVLGTIFIDIELFIPVCFQLSYAAYSVT